MSNENLIMKICLSQAAKDEFPGGVKRLSNKSNKGRSRQIAYIYQVLDELYESLKDNSDISLSFDEMVSLVMSNADIPGIYSGNSRKELMYDALECSLIKIGKGSNSRGVFYSVLNFLSSDAFVRSYEAFKRSMYIAEEQEQSKSKGVNIIKPTVSAKEEKTIPEVPETPVIPERPRDPNKFKVF